MKIIMYYLINFINKINFSIYFICFIFYKTNKKCLVNTTIKELYLYLLKLILESQTLILKYLISNVKA